MNRKESMKCNTLIIVGILLTVIAFFAIYHFKTPQNVNKIDTVYKSDTIWKHDSIKIFKEKPILKIVKIEKTDTFYTKDGKDTILQTQSKQYQDTLCQNKDSIILKSYISGVNPTLDSISAEWKKQETIITNTVEITKYIEKRKRFSYGPSITVGYDPINKNFGMMVGMSVFFDISH